MKKIGGLFLALLTFFGSSINVLADAIEEVVEEKTQTIDKKDYEALKEEVEKKVYNLNKEDDGYVYDFEISIQEEKDEVVVTETKKVTSEQKFTNKEDAQKYYDEYELEDSWKKGELSIVADDETVEVKGDQITITCKEATCSEEIAALESALKENEALDVISKSSKKVGLDKKTIVYSIDGKEQELYIEDALKLLGTLSPEYEGYSFVKNEMILVKEATIDVKTFEELMGNKKFETYEEAKAAADKFLESDVYKNQVAVVVAVYDDSEKETNVTTSIPLLSEELAWTALIADATAELEKAIEEGKISVEGKIEEIKQALKDAEKTGKLNLTTMELDGRVVYYSLPEQHINEISEDVKDVYDTEEKAQESLEKAKELAELAASKIEGARVEFENVEIIKNNTAVLDKGLEVVKISNYYSINQPNKCYSIKNGNNIVLWTENEIDETTKEALTASLKEENPSAEIKFLSGLNITETIEGIGSFTIKTKKLPIIGTIKAIFFNNIEDGVKVYYGDIKTGETYTLSYTAHMIVETWTYDKTEVKYGFDYYVDGIGEVHTRSLFQVQSILAKDIYSHTMAYSVDTTNTNTLYTAEFDVYKEELKTNATVAYKITRTEAASGSTGPVEDEEEKDDETIVTPEEDNKDEEIVVTPEEDNEGTGTVLPPQTGTTYNFYLEGVLLIGILVAAISLKKLCK